MKPPPFDTALRNWLYGLSGQTAAELPDCQLLQRFVCARDESAFALLVQRHGPLVLGVCRRLLRDSHDAEDAFQATFLVLACRAAAIRRTEALAGFLHSTAYRTAYRLRGQRSRRQSVQQQAARQRPEAIESTGDDRDTIDLLHEELNRLPRKYRDILILCYLQGKTNEEAARELDYPLGSMSRHLSRARELLRERLLARGMSAVLGAALAEQARAAVPSALLCGTLDTVRRHALASALLAGSTLPVAVALAQSILRAAWMTRVTLASMVLAVGVVFAGGVAILQTPKDKQPPAQAKPSAVPSDAKQQEPQPRRDLYGDLLPDGVLARMGTQRLRHPNAIGIAFAADGKTLISAGSDQTVRFWDRATGQLKRLQRVPRTPPIVALSPDGKTLALLDKEHLLLWDIAENKETKRLRTSNFTFDTSSDTMAFSPDGKTLAATDFHHVTFWLWDTGSGKELGHSRFETMGTLAFSSDGKKLAVYSGQRLVLWDVMAGKEIHAITGPKAVSRALAFSPDGKLLASAGGRAFVLWNAASGKEDAVLQLEPPGSLPRGYVGGAAFSPDGKLVAIQFDDYVALWDRSERKEAKRLHGPHLGRSDTHAQLGFSADGKQLASLRTGAIVLWDMASGKQIQEQPGHFASADSLAFSPDGNYLASAAGGDRTVRLWDARNCRQLHVWSMPHSLIGQLTFTPDGTKVIAEGFWGECRMWDVRSGEQRHIFRFSPGVLDGSDMPTAMRLSADGKRLTAMSLRVEGKGKRKRYLTTWDVANGERIERRTLAFDSRIILGWETISPDGRLVTAIEPRTASGPMIYDVVADRPLRILPHLASLSFSPDGKMLSYGGSFGSADALIHLMDTASGANLLSLSVGDGWLWNFTPDGRYLLTAGAKDLRLWELATGKEVLHRRFAQMNRASSRLDSGMLNCLVIAADGRSAATGLRDTNLLVWDLAPATRQKVKLRAADLERLWSELAGEDAPLAYRAAGTLIADPQRAVSFLSERLRPVQEDAPRIRKLIAGLDSEQFAVRDAAYKELEKMDDAAHAVLRQALPKAASLELRRRIETLLSAPWIVRSPEKLRQIRAVMVLEQIGEVATRRVLARLAGGAAEARLTREAKTALQRLRE